MKNEQIINNITHYSGRIQEVQFKIDKLDSEKENYILSVKFDEYLDKSIEAPSWMPEEGVERLQAYIKKLTSEYKKKLKIKHEKELEEILVEFNKTMKSK